MNDQKCSHCVSITNNIVLHSVIEYIGIQVNGRFHMEVKLAQIKMKRN